MIVKTLAILLMVIIGAWTGILLYIDRKMEDVIVLGLTGYLTTIVIALGCGIAAVILNIPVVHLLFISAAVFSLYFVKVISFNGVNVKYLSILPHSEEVYSIKKVTFNKDLKGQTLKMGNRTIFFPYGPIDKIRKQIGGK